MEHRGTARTRTVRLIVDGFGPEAGVSVTAGEKAVGTMGSSAGGHGLATLRIDRVAEAIKAGQPLSAGGVPIKLADEDEIKLPTKTAV